MYAIKPNKIVTRVLTVKPTEHCAPKDKEKNIILLVEMEEKYHYDNGAICEAKLDIRYGLLTSYEPWKMHAFDAHYQRSYQGEGGNVCITGTLQASSVFLDPSEIRGNRIGTYLMNEVVMWAKQWPLADVKPITLLSNQAGKSHEFCTERRNRFYERFGIAFEYAEPSNKESGYSKPMKANQLKEVESWQQNIKQQPLSDYLPKLFHELRSLEMEHAYVQKRVRESQKRAEKAEQEIGRRAWMVFYCTTVFFVAMFLGFWVNNKILINL
ncbi:MULTISPECIES: hypothetical protein [Deefgea]|uniref:N-acetyltransferase domain-containing protein n=1 Tax=Deefgea chitinilytica TaxID=570276 RepID=A0ABS2CAC8_9NEIS|nr:MULTISPECIES: hypothetical protein [Deefgea]MBM5571095.1 hypothetical protein [Deefgea chitinilytica]MBM9888325.1 hypothetical protein [Deefgea sp. CFH1-16]